MRLDDRVFLSLTDYNNLRDDLHDAQEKIAKMSSERDKICDKKSVRQVIKHIDCDGDIVTDELVNFDDVLEEINEAHDGVLVQQQKKIEELEEIVENFKKAIENKNEEIRKLKGDIYTLENRSLWKRIVNSEKQRV